MAAPLDTRWPASAEASDRFPVVGRLLAALAVVAVAAALSAGIAGYEHRASVVVAGIGLGAAILWNPFIGLLTLIASLPFETAGMLGDPNAPGALSIMKLAGLLTCGGLILDAFGRRRGIELRRVFHPLSILVVVLAIAMVVSSRAHPTEQSLRESVRFLTIVMFFFVTVHLVDTPERLRHAVTMWIVIATVVAIYSLLQRSFGATVGSEEWEPVAGTVIDVSEEDVGVMRRAAGPFAHPVWLALYLSVTLPLTLARCWSVKDILARAGWAVATLLQAAAIMATYSRMGYLAMAFGAALILMRRRGGPLLLALLVSTVLITTPAWPEDVKARILSIFDYTRSSSSVTRIGQQLVGLWMFRDQPLTGVGPGNFPSSVSRYADRVSDTLRIERIDAHNLYVQALAELGLQGVVVIVLLLLIGWRAAERCRRRARDPAEKLMYEAMSTSVVVFAASAVLIHAMYQKEWWLLLALIAAGDWLTAQYRTDTPRTAGPVGGSVQ